MKLDLNPEISKRLREKINEWHNFTYEKEANFKVPGKKIENTAKAYSCICACMDRIDDLVKHCNEIEIDNVWGLCDIFNYGQTLIDCITRIGRVYEASYDANGDTSSFRNSTSEGKGNDEKYFKYLRSLCSVHPVDTSQHPIYQGEENEWCPYIIEGRSPLARLGVYGNGWEDVDFYAVVYGNDMIEINKHIPIYVAEIVNYLRKRYEYIEEIIKAVECYNQNRVGYFKRKEILRPDAFDDYFQYLSNLKLEVKVRCGEESSYIYWIKMWQTVEHSHFKDEKMQMFLQEYKVSLKQKILDFHNYLQEMREEDLKSPREWYTTSFIKDGYALSKLSYLEAEVDNADDLDQIARENGDVYRDSSVQLFLETLEKERKNNTSDEELRKIARSIDGKYHVTNSEWARIQLKLIEPCFENVIEFDYFLSDWYLYLQVQIAIWLVNKKH